MIVGERLRLLREERRLSQGDIEKSTGLLRCYISRVENGHTIPALATLEKMARALEVPLYVLFYDGTEPPVVPKLLQKGNTGGPVWGDSGKDMQQLRMMRKHLAKMNERERKMVLFIGQKMSADRRRTAKGRTAA